MDPRPQRPRRNQPLQRYYGARQRSHGRRVNQPALAKPAQIQGRHRGGKPDQAGRGVRAGIRANGHPRTGSRRAAKSRNLHPSRRTFSRPNPPAGKTEYKRHTPGLRDGQNGISQPDRRPANAARGRRDVLEPLDRLFERSGGTGSSDGRRTIPNRTRMIHHMKHLLLRMRIINRRLTAIALAGAAALTLGTVSCKKQAATKPPDVDYYTCTMHPSVKSQDPNAKCPICSMDLVPVMKKRGASTQGAAEAKPQGKTDEKAVGMPGEKQAESAGGEAAHEVEGMKDMEEMKGMPSIAGMQKKEMKEEEPGEFMVAASRQQQIGVTYARVSNKPLQLSVRTVGTVAFDRIRHWNIVTRVDGYVDKLFVASAGELIEKGGPVINIYSPDLLTTQREFLDLLRARDEAKSSASAAVGESLDKLIEAAKGRLRLWSITDAQIQDLERERKPNVYLTLFAPVRGLVQNIEVSQGQ